MIRCMKSIFIVLLLFISPQVLAIGLPSEHLREETQKADLNEDGADDYVIISRKQSGGDPVLSLGIYFGGKDKLSETLNSDSILCGDCGSMKSGPNPYSISIKKNILFLTYFGGSRFVEERISKWRLEGKSFRLIGYTWTETDSVDPKGKTLVRDTNFLTGETIETLIKNSHKATLKCRSKLPRINLETFREASFQKPACSKQKLEI